MRTEVLLQLESTVRIALGVARCQTIIDRAREVIRGLPSTDAEAAAFEAPEDVKQRMATIILEPSGVHKVWDRLQRAAACARVGKLGGHEDA